MADFHGQPFDESTITKLEIFQLYAREWLPVFLSKEHPSKSAVHVYDFFSGPGSDSVGTLGSPLRLFNEFRRVQNLDGWARTSVTAHFFDADRHKIDLLRSRLSREVPPHSKLQLDVRALSFSDALEEAGQILANTEAAKLLLIDPFGVDIVTPEVFRVLVDAPTTDFLFFISSSTLNRFHDHPAIKQKITRPADPYHVHRAVLDYYRGLLKPNEPYYLGSFSIRKGTNIYGLIFGSAHALGMDKFLRVAWAKDALNGEANFDIHRDNIDPAQPKFQIEEFEPTKKSIFRQELWGRIREGTITNEAEIIELCFRHGVLRQYAREVIQDLQTRGVVEADFTTPGLDRLKNPRAIRFLADPLF